MKFTEAKFAETVELLAASGGAKTGKDNRRAERKDVRLTVPIKLNKSTDSPWINVQLRDISSRGVRFCGPQKIGVNDNFVLRLPGAKAKDSYTLLVCRVVNCRPDKDQFMIGAEFIGQETVGPQPSDDQKELDRIRRSILD
jgi:hypothetical protein